MLLDVTLSSVCQLSEACLLDSFLALDLTADDLKNVHCFGSGYYHCADSSTGHKKDLCRNPTEEVRDPTNDRLCGGARLRTCL